MNQTFTKVKPYSNDVCSLKGIYNSRTEALERKRNEKKIVKSSNRDNSPRLQDTAEAKVILDTAIYPAAISSSSADTRIHPKPTSLLL